ncbi:hypothetical protein L9F63_005876 [Diploptera punctata]|uniref:Uncharacterized protein n=1 Tax=Diploptera punctata TaxID=6984 RepID=A0AAD7ZBJ0_DIPPU|nr:hypothetical protein L9F63_005876 [Diploptera punctata]
MHAEKANISDSVELWIDLRECAGLQMHKDSIQRRMSEAVLPIHYLANVMNPKYVGRRLSSDQENQAESWFDKQTP